MGKPAAKKGDQVTGSCTHQVTTPNGAVPQVLPFAGIIGGGLSSDVRIMDQFAATKGSTAENNPQHVFIPAGAFVTPPNNKATISKGSGTVKINGKPAARSGDTAETCDEMKSPGTIVASGTVSIGD
jgi:uncharacterized Zn-binding protein involved in type VI secretion